MNMISRLLTLFDLAPGQPVSQRSSMRSDSRFPDYDMFTAAVNSMSDGAFGDRGVRYADYELMDQHAHVNTALDIYRNWQYAHGAERGAMTKVFPEIVAVNAEVRRLQKQARCSYPDIESALVEWYGRVPVDCSD